MLNLHNATVVAASEDARGDIDLFEIVDASDPFRPVPGFGQSVCFFLA